MSVTIDGPADFPALYRSADRESVRAQRSYLTSLRVRLGALLVAAFGGGCHADYSGRLPGWRRVGFSGFRLRAGSRALPRHHKPPHRLVRRPGCGGVGQDTRLAVHGASRTVRSRRSRGRCAVPCPDLLAAAGPSLDLRWMPASRASIKSATRCAKCGPSTSLGVGRSIWRSGLPTSNAGTPRRPGGTTSGRAYGCW